MLKCAQKPAELA